MFKPIEDPSDLLIIQPRLFTSKKMSTRKKQRSEVVTCDEIFNEKAVALIGKILLTRSKKLEKDQKEEYLALKKEHLGNIKLL